ncbi:MAG TPA: hypothetical protein ENN68_08460 [Methanomicrobia archaeon]|nr:hypothetical protein [Methanomicrobia archaeon]
MAKMREECRYKDEEEIEINIKLWWGVEIRKITVRKGETAIVVRPKNMGYVSMSDERLQNVFAGIIKGLFGITGEITGLHLTVRRDGTEKSLQLNRMEDLETLVRKTFIEK